MKFSGPLIAPSLIALLLTASAANGQSTITIPCSRVDEFVHGAIDVPAGAAVKVSAVTVSQLIARVGGPENFARLMRTPEGRQAVRDAGAISDEEFAWCKQRVEQELARRQRAAAERPVGPFDQHPSRPAGELMATHDACVRAADAAGPQYSEAWKQRFASCLDTRAPQAASRRPLANAESESEPKPPRRTVDLTRLLTDRPAALAVIPFTPGRPIYVDVRINGGARARLLLDTGADGTIVAPRVLQAAGLAPRRGSATLRGVTGAATVDVYEIASLEVGGARVGRLTVFAYDTGESGMDGLLGRDFLDQFKVTIDSAAGWIRLSPK